jgi:hypothetical protein
VDSFVTIEELVAEWEADPEKLKHLKAARARLAPLISKPGDGRYERLMRGEGPPRDDPQHEAG